MFPAIAIASLLATVTYLYTQLYRQRFKKFAHLPQLPASLLWGHLRLFDEIAKQKHADCHSDAVFEEVHRRLGKPPLFLLNMWPVTAPIVVVGSYEVAEQTSRPSKEFPYSMPRAPAADRMVHILGSRSIFSHHKESWRRVRRRYNPGFSPGHLLTLLPCILDKSMTFLNLLDHVSQSGEPFKLLQLTTNLTFDIISAVCMDVDMDAQYLDESRQSEFSRLFKEILRTYEDDKVQLPWWMVPLLNLKRRRLGRLITDRLQAIVRQKYSELQNRSSSGRTPRTVLELSLKDTDELTPEILTDTCDNLKAFLLAGHDTTSILLAWAVYELSLTPRALKAVQTELENIFGPGITRDPQAMSAKLLAPGGEELVYQMPYISAVIKETLRLHPPVGSIRMPSPGAGFVVHTPDGDYSLDGAWVYLNAHIIHRDRKVYGDSVDEFRPERWLRGTETHNDSDTTGSVFSNLSSEYPPGSWRSFERGPRNCIGQELANIEARVILALLACRYDFSKVGIGELDLDEKSLPVLNQSGQYCVKSELYNTMRITARPVDGMVMKAKLQPSAMCI